MSENRLSIRAGGAPFHPITHHCSPAAVLGDIRLSAAEKRLILSSWASDMYAVEQQPGFREIPGVAQPLRLADILAALRQLDQEDQPPPPRGGAAMRVVPYTKVSAVGAPSNGGGSASREERAHSLHIAGRRAPLGREANVQRYRRLLATGLTDHERRFVERRLAEELRDLNMRSERCGLDRAGVC
jgi:hypothetical protein